jgi:hypothetical protein
VDGKILWFGECVQHFLPPLTTATCPCPPDEFYCGDNFLLLIFCSNFLPFFTRFLFCCGQNIFSTKRVLDFGWFFFQEKMSSETHVNHDNQGEEEAGGGGGANFVSAPTVATGSAVATASTQADPHWESAGHVTEVTVANHALASPAPIPVSLGPTCLYAKEHGRKLAEGLQLLRLQGSLLDLEIVCSSDAEEGMEPLRAHKSVLAAVSTFFRQHLTRAGLPNMPAELRLEDFGLASVSREAVRILLEFAYRGEVVVPAGYCDKVRAAAEALGFQGLTGALKATKASSVYMVTPATPEVSADDRVAIPQPPRPPTPPPVAADPAASLGHEAITGHHSHQPEWTPMSLDHSVTVTSASNALPFPSGDQTQHQFLPAPMHSNGQHDILQGHFDFSSSFAAIAPPFNIPNDPQQPTRPWTSVAPPSDGDGDGSFMGGATIQQNQQPSTSSQTAASPLGAKRGIPLNTPGKLRVVEQGTTPGTAHNIQTPVATTNSVAPFTDDEFLLHSPFRPRRPSAPLLASKLAAWPSLPEDDSSFVDLVDSDDSSGEIDLLATPAPPPAEDPAPSWAAPPEAAPVSPARVDTPDVDVDGEEDSSRGEPRKRDLGVRKDLTLPSAPSDGGGNVFSDEDQHHQWLAGEGESSIGEPLPDSSTIEPVPGPSSVGSSQAATPTAAFKSKSELSTTTLPPPFQCVDCPMEFSDSAQLRQHVRYGTR